MVLHKIGDQTENQKVRRGTYKFPLALLSRRITDQRSDYKTKTGLISSTKTKVIVSVRRMTLEVHRKGIHQTYM
jgi:hypothetical protein